MSALGYSPAYTFMTSSETKPPLSRASSSQDQYNFLAKRIQEVLTPRNVESSSDYFTRDATISKTKESPIAVSPKPHQKRRIIPALRVRIPEPAKRTYDLSHAFTVEILDGRPESDATQLAESAARRAGVSPSTVLNAGWRKDRLAVEVQSYEAATTLARDENTVVFQDISYRWGN